MLRIATVEDDANDLEALRTHLSRYEKENGLKFQVTEFRDGEDIVTDYSADYDLILMDIEMAFLNGMKAAEKIRELDKDVIIIFITNMPQYAIQGYKVNALDYMLKPISYFSFSESMGKSASQSKRTGKRIYHHCAERRQKETGYYTDLLCGGAGPPSALSYNRRELCDQRNDPGCGKSAGCKKLFQM